MRMTIRRSGDSRSWSRLSWSLRHGRAAPGAQTRHGLDGCCCWNGWQQVATRAFSQSWRFKAFSSWKSFTEKLENPGAKQQTVLGHLSQTIHGPETFQVISLGRGGAVVALGVVIIGIVGSRIFWNSFTENTKPRNPGEMAGVIRGPWAIAV